MVNGAGAGGVRPRKTSLALEAMLAAQMAAKLDRSFRSALDALKVVEDRGVALHLLVVEPQQVVLG
jgi:hypothetical protein